jgi:hypothetical protein
MSLYSFKPNLYLVLEELDGTPQSIMAEVMQDFSTKVLVPHLQKWRKSKEFKEEWSTFTLDQDFPSVSFLTLQEILKKDVSKKKKHLS